MIINLPTKEDGFFVKPVEFCGLDALLINPAIEPVWKTDNLHFRSLIICKHTNEVLSMGYPKFFNYGESAQLYPDPKEFSDYGVYCKEDGTLVICDYVNGRFNMRTRGTVSYKTQENWTDFEILIQNYPNIIDLSKEYFDYSFLFELETPNNVIVIRNTQIKFTFLGVVNKKTLKHVSEKEYLALADKLFMRIPIKYKSDDIIELSKKVKEWENTEGIVLSYNNFQNRVKIKTDWYLIRHRMISHMSSLNSVIKFFEEKGSPTREELEKIIEKEFDYEMVVSLTPLLDQLYKLWSDINYKLLEIGLFLQDPVFKDQTRKEQAKLILDKFGKWSKIAFNFLDKKAQDVKKLFELIREK